MNKLPRDNNAFSRIGTFIAVAGILIACGTRVGNPKKPDQDNQLVKLPTIQADIPENDIDASATASFGLLAQDSGNTATLATGIPSGRQSVLSFNELAQKINESEIRVDETYTRTIDGKVISALVTPGEAPFAYSAVICADKKLFMAVNWTEDFKSVSAVRHIDEIPFSDVRARHTNDGTSIMQEISWNSEVPVQLSLWQTRIPPKQQTLIKNPDRIIDAFRIRITPEGVAEFTGVNDLQYKKADSGGDVNIDDFIADIRVAGQIRPDRKHFYLGHLEGANLICPQEFDEDNQSKPGWCFGLRRRNVDKKDYSFLNRPEIDNAWALIDDMEIVKESELKEVKFPVTAACPE